MTNATPSASNASGSTRSSVVRLGRGPGSWLLRAAIASAGLVAIVAAVFLVVGDGLSTGFWIAAVSVAIVFIGTVAGIAAAARGTWLDVDAREISIKRGAWAPLSEVRVAKTGWYQGSHYVTIGTDPQRTFHVGDALFFGQDRKTLRLVYWVVQSSSIPEAADASTGTASKSEVLDWIKDWA